MKRGMSVGYHLTSGRVEAEDFQAAMEECYRRHWTDGLPVIPPTEDKVEEILTYLGRDPQEEVGIIPPKNGVATLEKIAINCVMAGCLPQHVPVVLAALEAMLEEDFNLGGVQTTTHSVVPLTIVNGPIVKELGFNYGDVVFGSGFRANAAVGRAIKLIRWNIGGSYPGELDRTSIGHPGEYCFCIAENEDANPWEPLHVERGFRKEDSAVTVFGCEAPHSVHTGPGNALNILVTMASSMATLGNNNLALRGETMVVFGPRSAAILAHEGWAKPEIKRYLYEKARLPGSLVKMGPQAYLYYTPEGRQFPKWVDLDDPGLMVPVVNRPDDIHIVVAGGWGSNWAFAALCPGWGRVGGLAQTKRVNIPIRR